MGDDARQRAAEFLGELFDVGDIDAAGFDAGLSELYAARTETELAEVIRALPAPRAITGPGRPVVAPPRQLPEPLEIHAGVGRLRLGGAWKVARQTRVSAWLGSVTLDLTAAEFDERVVDLHVFTSWGRITIIVPRGADVQVSKHHTRVDSQLGTAAPGLPRIRLDVTTNIGRVRLRHPRHRKLHS